MSPQLLSVVVLLVFLTVVLLKAYAIGIVWRCYKYLTMRQHNIRSMMLPYIIPEISARRVIYCSFISLIIHRKNMLTKNGDSEHLLMLISGFIPNFTKARGEGGEVVNEILTSERIVCFDHNISTPWIFNQHYFSVYNALCIL